MDPTLTRRHVSLTTQLRSLLLTVAASGSLTARGQDRVLRLARTIADLDGRSAVEPGDLEQAIGYRLGSRTAVAA